MLVQVEPLGQLKDFAPLVAKLARSGDVDVERVELCARSGRLSPQLVVQKKTEP